MIWTDDGLPFTSVCVIYLEDFQTNRLDTTRLDSPCLAVWACSRGEVNHKKDLKRKGVWFAQSPNAPADHGGGRASRGLLDRIGFRGASGSTRPLPRGPRVSASRREISWARARLPGQSHLLLHPFFRRVVDAAQGGSGTEPRSLAPAGDGHDDDDDDDDDEDGVAAFKPCRLRSPWQAGIRLRFPGAWSLHLLEDGSALAPPPPKKPKKVRKGPGEGGPQERGGIEQPQE